MGEFLRQIGHVAAWYVAYGRPHGGVEHAYEVVWNDGWRRLMMR